jgi:alpha-beta hydrolase superfamily lysophospholipase
MWKEFTKGMAKLWDKDKMKKVSKDQSIYITSGAEDGHGRWLKGPKWLIKEYLKLGVKDVRYKFYPHMRHEIHNEKGKEEGWFDLANEILRD